MDGHQRFLSKRGLGDGISLVRRVASSLDIAIIGVDFAGEKCSRPPFVGREMTMVCHAQLFHRRDKGWAAFRRS